MLEAFFLVGDKEYDKGECEQQERYGSCKENNERLTLIHRLGFLDIVKIQPPYLRIQVYLP